MSRSPDQLYDLLPRWDKLRDAQVGEPLRALLAVIAEQVDLTRTNIEQLYANWFIETCDDWVVPYLGDLVGYQILPGYAEALSGGDGTSVAEALAGRLAPRRDVADTVHDRRRKGTLALLAEVAGSVADWPAKAVEFARITATTAPIRWYEDPATPAPALPGTGLSAVAVRERRGRLVDLRDGLALDLLDSPFDTIAHRGEVRRVDSASRAPGAGRYAPPEVGVFVWRLAPFPLTHAPAHCIDRARNEYTFSILGNDTQLVVNPVAEPSAEHSAAIDNVPTRISRRLLSERLADLYGPGKSFAIWRDGETDPIPPANIVVADLSQWTYKAKRGQVVVDPETGRMVFNARSAPRQGVWVTYHYAAVEGLGGGEYPREVTTPQDVTPYRVGPSERFERITDAFEQWRADQAAGTAGSDGIIELTASSAFQEQLEFVLEYGERFTLRAADGARPVIRLLDWYSNRPDALVVRGPGLDAPEASDPNRGTDAPHVVLDGLLITGRGVQVNGDIATLSITDSTLVPGWTLAHHCGPLFPEEPSLILEATSACTQISKSILGSILVITDEVRHDPLPIHIADSVLDATARDLPALSGPDCCIAFAELHLYRSTVIGEVHTHAIQIAENSILSGNVNVARRGVGCVRFCYAPQGSRTPRRYDSQPDLVLAAVAEQLADGLLTTDQAAGLQRTEPLRVRPLFTSQRYGTAAYAQLSSGCAREIVRGAEDGSELGVYHNLYQPQREDNLTARLTESTPAGFDAGIIYVS
ncbi:hypothetical protein [Catenulispora rubra]|uniref:hypothetical protein n=1 Tax=Catenulispora rubra TaxID=280293 RepID=UPI0018926801|nr:hypothetical protein [Catenulispora rubra]